MFFNPKKKNEWKFWDYKMSKKVSEIIKGGEFKEIEDPVEKKFYFWLLEELSNDINFNKLNTLELGAGSGAFSYYLQKRFRCSVTLLDNSKNAIKYAKLLNYRAKILEKDARQSFGISKYNFIHTTGLLEHLNDKDIKQIIKNIKRALKPNGIAFLAVPNYFSPALITLWKIHGKGSERYITIRDLKKYIKSYGFNLIAARHSYFSFEKITRYIWLEKIIGRLGLGFLNYIIVQK